MMHSDVKSRQDRPDGGRISIGVATRRRPAMLEQCLRSLAAQAVPDGTELAIVVIENDCEEYSRDVVAAVERQSPIPIEYHLERNIGISNARNAVLDAAIANGSDYLAFIDDDELAYPEWISRLFAAMREHGAMIAGGPVLRTFQCEKVPEWAARYFPPILSRQGGWPNIIPGSLPGGSGNMLFDLAPVRENGIDFDIRFNLCGAEDLAFIEAYMDKCDGGSRSVHVNDALVCEVIPESRLKPSYIFMSKIRIMSHMARIEKGPRPGFGFIANKAFSGLSHIAAGGLLFVLTYFVNRTWSMIFLMKVAAGIGMLYGLAGYHPSTYSKVTGQ